MAKVMLVTGASRGIGAATARLAAESGWDICINYVHDRAAAEEVADDVRKAGRRAVVVQADVADEAAVCCMFDTVDAELGKLDALVNNAGISGGARRRADELSAAGVNAVLAANVTGTIICAREAIFRMSTKHGGSGGAIVNVSSIAARIGSPGLWVDYAASKGAVDSFTIGLAAELAGEGIRVNGVRPGLIDTDIHATAGMPDRVARTAGKLPMQRAGKAEEVAQAIVWLASGTATYVSGAIVDVAGAV